MARPLVLVKNGIAYTHRGEKLAPVDSDDGYYYDVPSQWIVQALKGKAKPIEFEYRVGKVIPCVIISDYPHLIDADGNMFTVGSIPDKVEIGETILVYLRHYYYYIPEQSTKTTLLDDLAAWFVRFPAKSPWIKGKKGHRLTPALSRWAKKSEHGTAVWSIVKTDNRDFMKTPDEIRKAVSARVKKRLGFIKSKLNKQIADIGGKITAISVDWQKGVALVWVRFTVNGVDPTNGGGCLCYLNGDFYYGPWCQRIRQKDLADKIELLHDYPPKYTLRSWIIGPLYSTALYARENHRKMESAISGEPPKYFEPTGVVMLAKGASRTSDNDGLKSEKSDPKAMKQRAENLAELFIVKAQKIVEKNVSELFDEGEMILQTHDPFMRVPIEWPYPSSGIANYLKTTGKSWRVCVRPERDNGGRFEISNELNGHEFSVDVQGGKFGFAPEVFSNGFSDFRRYAYHYQILVEKCTCSKCKEMREAVHRIIAFYGSSFSKTPAQLLSELTEKSPPF